MAKKIVWLQSWASNSTLGVQLKHPAFAGQAQNLWPTYTAKNTNYSWIEDISVDAAADYFVSKGWAIYYDNWWTYPNRPAKVSYPYQ